MSSVDEVVDHPLCEERARVKSLLAVVNTVKVKKSSGMTERTLTVCPVNHCKSFDQMRSRFCEVWYRRRRTSRILVE